jgi:putative acetyltransferase
VDGLNIRDEHESEREAVRAVHRAAFGNSQEADLVGLLRAHGKASLSLVALVGNRVVGHVLFSPVSVEVMPAESRIEPAVLGLGPVGVVPELQKRGVGSRLIEHGLAACRRGGCHAVVVLGHPSYYPRFGFRKASDHGLFNEYNADDAFMVLDLVPNALDGIRGLVRYAAEFAEVDG